LSTWPQKGKLLPFHTDPPIQKRVDALVGRRDAQAPDGKRIGDKA
jgi:hypothetical protein